MSHDKRSSRPALLVSAGAARTAQIRHPVFQVSSLDRVATDTLLRGGVAGAAVPDARRPHLAVPDARRPHLAVPNARVPHLAVPDARVPHLAVPNARVPHLAVLGRGTGAGWPLQFVTLGIKSLASLEPHAIGLTYWFDAAEEGDPYPVSVRFRGRRLDVEGKTGPTDAFQVVASLEGVLPGSGRVALTHRVNDVAPGRWLVTADARASAPAGHDGAGASARRLPRGTTEGVSTYAPFVRVRAPGVVLGAWPALVGLGVVAALTLESMLAARRGLPVLRVLLIALISSLVGLIGAKVYYRLTHREEEGGFLRTGMSIQGFVIAAIGTTLLGSVVGGLSFGPVLDVTAPSLLVGQAIGRLGCFFGGCCVGLPTSSRWGLWSSDRTVGVRRIPVQLMESALAASLALAALLTVLWVPLRVGGLVFVAGFAAYTVGRQLLFPLRDLPRKTTYGRQLTVVLAGAALVAAVGVGAFA